jgi:hypothetical protein
MIHKFKVIINCVLFAVAVERAIASVSKSGMRGKHRYAR